MRKNNIMLAGALLATSALFGAEPKVLTQTPVVVPSHVRGTPMPQVKPRPRKPDPGPPPSWIWGADPDRRYFLRKEFPGGATTARLKATCDNRVTVYLNGHKVLRNDTWERPVERDVTKFLKPGNNVLLAAVTNEGGPAGFICRLTLSKSEKDRRYVVSDKTWQAAEDRMKGPWVAAREVARLGEGPWGDAFHRDGDDTNADAVFTLAPGFQVERLFTVPRDDLGSWVSITFDDKGRLIASDEGGKGLCRVTPPRIGSREPTRVEPLDVKVTGAQGMLYAFGILYLSVNGGPGSGLYRVRATHGGDRFDELVKLQPLAGGGEHGPHGLRRGPDGRSIYLVCGNHTDPPAFDRHRVPANWAEDLLLPRQWDANGHAVGRLAPGGWIMRTEPDAKTWEVVSIGYRNSYDIAFNADGELFTYDSDMEWDMGMPWYRPTRLVHATGGSELGWRSGSGVWPAYFVDSLPPVLDVGPGSPVGIEFGYGARFPARYQRALFCCDWTFGTMYAMHLEPAGSSYRAVKEEFLSRTPLPLTDAAVGPDGALYFTVGGRGIQSELFRVTYVGKEPTAPVEYRDGRCADQRALRHQLEQYHAPADHPDEAVALAYPHLGHPDRFIRYAARVALEHQPLALWQDRVLAESDPERLITGAVALARQGGRPLQSRLLAALGRLDLARLPGPQPLELLRVYQLVFIRMGPPDAPTAERLTRKFDALYPAAGDLLNRELSALLVYLKSPTVLAKTIALMKRPGKPAAAVGGDELLARNRGYGDTIARMQANAPDAQKLHYAFVLRNLGAGWTMDQRKFYFTWLDEARKHSGGASYQGFINNIEKDAFANASDADRLAIEAAGLRKPFKPKALPKPHGPGRDWTMPALLALQNRLRGRSYANGERAYAAARCIVCHRFGGEGGATGPDLTQLAGRFGLKEIAESILEPSKVVSDQYKASVIATASGKMITGRIVSESKDALAILTDPEDSTKIAQVKKADVEQVSPSPISLMPDNLLRPLNEDEVLDLLAYLLSRGDPAGPMFRK